MTQRAESMSFPKGFKGIFPHWLCPLLTEPCGVCTGGSVSTNFKGMCPWEFKARKRQK